MQRRTFLQKTLVASLGLTACNSLPESPKSKGFFKIRKKGQRWWLIDPQGKPFYSLALNHIDLGSLMYPENVHIWRDKYHNSMEKWLRQVGKDIREWGFNSVGWVTEVIVRNKDMHAGSGFFTYEEYQWLGLPYCHRLPFAEFHHWDTEHRHPPLFTSAFEDWCDYVARKHCTRHAENPNLIGYFYIDCPAWIHHKKTPGKGHFLTRRSLTPKPANRQRGDP